MPIFITLDPFSNSMRSNYQATNSRDVLQIVSTGQDLARIFSEPSPRLASNGVWGRINDHTSDF